MVKITSYNLNRLNIIGTNLIKGKAFHSSSASIITYVNPDAALASFFSSSILTLCVKLRNEEKNSRTKLIY